MQNLHNMLDFTVISFKGKHYVQSVILTLVRWYLAYSLSYRDVEELAKERGMPVDHSTIQRWGVEYSPQLENQFRTKNKSSTDTSWRMDETYLKLKGKDVYLYRAVDKYGKTIDFMFSEKRDKSAVRAYFTKCIGQHGLPDKVTMDKSGANKAGIDAINLQLMALYLLTGIYHEIEIRQIKYLNNIIEQDHRFIKKITKPMRGFKYADSAVATLAGIELHHMLRKGQRQKAANMPVYEHFYQLAV